MSDRRFPPPWTFDEANHACFIVRDGNRFPVAYVYFESEPGRRAAANLMHKDEARRIAAGRQVTGAAEDAARRLSEAQLRHETGQIWRQRTRHFQLVAQLPPNYRSDLRHQFARTS